MNDSSYLPGTYQATSLILFKLYVGTSFGCVLNLKCQVFGLASGGVTYCQTGLRSCIWVIAKKKIFGAFIAVFGLRLDWRSLGLGVEVLSRVLWSLWPHQRSLWSQIGRFMRHLWLGMDLAVRIKCQLIVSANVRMINLCFNAVLITVFTQFKAPYPRFHSLFHKRLYHHLPLIIQLANYLQPLLSRKGLITSIAKLSFD